MLRVNILSFVKSKKVPTGGPQAARCQAMSTGPTRGCQASPSSSQFLIVWPETFTPVACWRSFCRVLALLIQFLLIQKTHQRTLIQRYPSSLGPADTLRNFYSPVELSKNNCLSPGICSMLLRLCWKTEQIFCHWHMLMCHPRGEAVYALWSPDMISWYQ